MDIYKCNSIFVHIYYDDDSNDKNRIKNILKQIFRMW